MDDIKKTPDQLKAEAKEKAVMQEMMPYFIFALIPIALTLMIAYVCAPKMTLP